MAASLSTTVWVCAYWPVRIEARLGEQEAVETNAVFYMNAFLCQPIHSGVCSPLILFMNPIAS
jgi:hypothetical protein